jgi:asparagine synthase (glutamine-hydrolysing)
MNELSGQFRGSNGSAGRPADHPVLSVGDANKDAALAEQDGVRVAIVGTPHFADAALRRIQAEAGAAQAVLAAYRQDRASLLQKISGAFALAILDEARHSALLAIDRLGIHPLCYAVDDTFLSFASNADSVSGLRNRSAQISPQSLFDYLYFHVIPAPVTIHQGVARLPPGYCLRFEAGHARLEPYWQPVYVENDPSAYDSLRTDFLQTVRDSVRRAMPDNLRVGAFLSGGTDSSTISGMLGEVSGAPAKTYSIGFDAQGFDEMEYARIAAKHFKTEHHEYYITPDDLADSIPLVAAAYDQPFGNSSALPAYYCARMARQDGIDVILGGDGGDELFGGNVRYAKQRVFGYYDNLPGWAQGLAHGLLDAEIMSKPPLIRKARSYIQQASVPMPDRQQTYNLLARLGHAEVLESGFLASVNTQLPLAHLREEYARCQAPSLINKMLALDLKITLADNDLPKVVKTCELAGVSAAFPFLDDSVVAFSNRLQPEYKLKGLQLRWFFKEALRGFLPDAILTKQKHGFGLPFGIWVSQHARLRDLAFGSLEQLGKRGIVKPAFIQRLTSDFLSDHASYYGEMVWVMMMLEQWLAAKQPGFRL